MVVAEGVLKLITEFDEACVPKWSALQSRSGAEVKRTEEDDRGDELRQNCKITEVRIDLSVEASVSSAPSMTERSGRTWKGRKMRKASASMEESVRGGGKEGRTT